jgi:energy-coupling factor transporter transmembrane protein EcfT
MTEAAVGSGAAAGAGFVLIIYVAVIVLLFVGWVKILRKAGYSAWWSLLMLVPLVNIVMFLVFAFGDWPALRNQRPGSGEPPYPPYPSYPVGWSPGQPGGTQPGATQWPGGSQPWPGSTEPSRPNDEWGR